MSGRTGMRGYLVQVLITLLDALNDTQWVSLMLEPNVESDKADLVFSYPDKQKAIQVKHSQNPFSQALVKRWAEELENQVRADEYVLKLVGPCNIDVTQLTAIGRVQIPTPIPLNIVAFIESAAQKFDKYLHLKGISQIPPLARELIIDALTSKLSALSTQDNCITRGDFDKLLTDWLLVIYPNCLNQAVQEMSEQIEHLKNRLRHEDRIAEAKYQLKFKACMEALAVVDEIFLLKTKTIIDPICKKHNSKVPNYKKVAELSESVRKCHNNLVLTCDSVDVVELFLTIAGFRQTYSADIIVDFRQAVRKELGFTGEIVDKDRQKAWIGTCYSEEQWSMKSE